MWPPRRCLERCIELARADEEGEDDEPGTALSEADRRELHHREERKPAIDDLGPGERELLGERARRYGPVHDAETDQKFTTLLSSAGLSRDEIETARRLAGLPKNALPSGAGALGKGGGLGGRLHERHQLAGDRFALDRRLDAKFGLSRLEVCVGAERPATSARPGLNRHELERLDARVPGLARLR